MAMTALQPAIAFSSKVILQFALVRGASARQTGRLEKPAVFPERRRKTLRNKQTVINTGSSGLDMASKAQGALMERTEALNTLRREYQADYQKEIRAARDMLATGIRLLQGTEGSINFADKVSFVSLGQARKRFVDALGPAIKPVLEAYSRELEREAASLGLDGQVAGDAPLMESLHDVLRHLQRAAEPQQQAVGMPPSRAMGGGHYS